MCIFSNKSSVLEEKVNPEEFYQPLFDSAGEGIILVNNIGNIILANKRTRSLFGYNKNELIGNNIQILIPNRFSNRHQSHIQSYFGTPKARTMGKGLALAGVKKDGTEFPLEISLNHFQSNGNTYAIALITDITDRRKNEQEIIDLNEKLEQRVKERTEQLSKSENLYSTIAKNFPDGIINVFDKNFNYIFVEGRELDKLGINKTDLIGTSYLDRFSFETATHINNELQNVLKGTPTSLEITLENSHYILEAVPLRNSEDEIEQLLVIEKNVTLQKEAENEMKRSLKKERELNSMKSRFVSMASHEFRTPLGTILSSASLLSRYTDTSQQPNRDRHILKIKSSVSNLTTILNDFLSLEKLEAGKIPSSPEYFNIKETCYAIKDDVKGLLKIGQEIIYNHFGVTSKVFLDKQILINTLLNLISNAIKYSSEAQNIILETHISDKEILISVEDHGIGIPIEEQNHLFERFFRANNATNIQGTGLGLNITKRYVELMKGDISFESKEGKGTKFIITIPY